MTEEFKPLVSIVIPVYNGSNYMGEAIDSALAQTYKNTEVLVINDGSSDNGATREIALSYGDKIRYFEKENGGVATALNLGIREMKGEYFSWLSHDDVYYPDKIEKQIDYFSKSNDKNVILYSDYEYINHNSSLINVVRVANIEPENFRYELMHAHPIHGCTVLIPQTNFKTIGLFDEHLITSQDYDLWFRMAGKFNFIHLPLVLIKSRVHQQQGSRTIPSFANEIDNYYKKCLDTISGNELLSMSKNANISQIYWKLALKYKMNGYSSASHKALELSNKSTFFNKMVFELVIKSGKILRKVKWIKQ